MAPGPRSATRGAVVGMLVVLAVLAAACTGGGSPQEPPTSSESVALSVETVRGGEGLDEPTRTATETAIGDVLSRYVTQAFLGDFPRREFVPAFESFSSGAARSAAQDIDVLTASPVQDATAMRATRLDARLALLVEGGRARGATAKVDFEFEATMPDGDTRPVSLRGRLMLSQDDGTWSVFGYDIALDDGAPLATEQSP